MLHVHAVFFVLFVFLNHQSCTVAKVFLHICVLYKANVLLNNGQFQRLCITG